MTRLTTIDDERRNIAELLRDWPPAAVDAIIQEMLALWNAEDLCDRICWRWNSRLRTTIGRALLEEMILELNPILLGRNPDEMRGVVVHELAHLVHMNHSKEFHSLVNRYLPNSKTLREQLKKIQLDF